MGKDCNLSRVMLVYTTPQGAVDAGMLRRAFGGRDSALVVTSVICSLDDATPYDALSHYIYKVSRSSTLF